MKTKLILLSFFFNYYFNTLHGQRLTPDVDVISEIISQKQDEIKRRVLKNLIVKNIKTTNYTTYNSMYNLMSIITTEKNKTVMTKDILREVANYAINYSLAEYFIKNILEEESLIYYVRDNRETVKKIDENALAMLIGSRFTIEKDKNNTDQVQTEPRKKINNENIKRYWEANYIIDRMYESLSNASIPVMNSIGIFRKDDLQTRFTSGLGINYEKEINDSDRIRKINSKLEEFIGEIQNLLQSQSTEEVFVLLKNYENFNFKNLKDTSEDTIRLLFKLFSFSLSEFKSQIGKNSFLAKIGEIVESYVIYELAANDEGKVFKHFKIDVEAIILSFEDRFTKKTYMKNNFIGIKPFFVIGMNYGVFANSNSTILEDDGDGSISDLAFVSEKFGVKLMLADFGYTRSHKPNEWYKYRGRYYKWLQPKSEPLIDEIYVSLYGSGILYNIVDLKSKDNFDFGMIGIGTGISFFNNLELNISYAVPFIDKSLSYQNGMFALGFDIPIFEYIAAIKKKNK